MKRDTPTVLAFGHGQTYRFRARHSSRPRQCANTYRGLTPKSVIETRLS